MGKKKCYRVYYEHGENLKYFDYWTHKQHNAELEKTFEGMIEQRTGQQTPIAKIEQVGGGRNGI